MVITHNLLAMCGERNLKATSKRLEKSSEKLSSGYRLNRASDDAASLAISEKMRSQIRGLKQASSNAQEGISMIQTADGAMSEMHSILQRIREIYVKNCNDTNTQEEREALFSESAELTKELDNIANNTEFNKKKLLTGDVDNITESATTYTFSYNNEGVMLQVGSNKGEGVKVNFPDCRIFTDANPCIGEDVFAQNWNYNSGSLGTYESFFNLFSDDATSKAKYTAPYSASLSGPPYNEVYMDTIDYAINKVSSSRATLGAAQNRLEHAIANDDNTAMNVQNSESLLRDTDMAAEMVKYSKEQILQQVGQSVLVQTNSINEGVLKLLQ